MTFLDRTRGTDNPPIWFVAEKDGPGTYARAHRSLISALAEFNATLATAAESGEPYTPLSRARRLMVTGPDWVRQPWNPDDPLLIGDAALRDALTPDEYRLYVTGPLAAALLES
jgi:hypothetical protein